MARIDKYKMNDIYNLVNHDKREHTQGRENIDKERSYLNYNLYERDIEEYEYIKMKIEESKKSGGRFTDDTNILVSTIVTLPKDFPNNQELERQFFKACLDLIINDFGEDNIVSAWTHYDEKSKHIHIKTLPIRKQEKKYKNGTTKEILQFNAKSYINLQYLKTFHTRLDENIEDYIGFKTSVINGATKKGNQTTKQLKQKSKLEAEIQKEKEELEKLRTHSINYPDILEIERRKIIDRLWKEYQQTSRSYWENYKAKKENINLCMIELKKQIYGTEQQLYKDLDFISNLSNGLLFAIISLISAVITLTCKNILQHELKTLKSDLERLNDKRRSISNYQNNVKEKLKKEDLEEIEKAMLKWEKSLNNIDNKLEEVTQKKEEYYIDYEIEI